MAKARKTADRRDLDGAWKNLLENFFYDAMKRCIPSLYAAARRDVKPEFLDKEFKKITAKHAEEASGTADFLISVPLESGEDEWVMLHLETQGAGGDDLSERMFRYLVMIYARYNKNITALAIATDKRPPDEPPCYRSSLFGTTIAYDYNRVVVPDLDDAELTASDNPFDLALYAGKKASAGKRSERRRFTYMKELLYLLHQRGWSHSEKMGLLNFIDSIMHVTTPELIEDLSNYESEIAKGDDDIVLVSYIEEKGYNRGMEKGMEKGIEKGMEKGIEKGEKRGRAEMAKNLLACGISPDIIAKSSGLSLEEIEKL